MDETERRNPGLVLAGTFREGVCGGRGDRRRGSRRLGAVVRRAPVEAAAGRGLKRRTRSGSAPGAARSPFGRRSRSSRQLQAAGHDHRAGRDQDHGRRRAGRAARADRQPRPVHQADRRRHARGPDRPRGALAQGPSHRSCPTGSISPRSASGKTRRDALVGADRSSGRRCPSVRRGHQQPAAARAAAARCGPTCRSWTCAATSIPGWPSSTPTRSGAPSSSPPAGWCGSVWRAGSASGLPPEVMLPAPGQGALAVTVRAGRRRRRQRRRERRCTTRRPRSR